MITIWKRCSTALAILPQKDKDKKMYRKIFPVERGKQDKEAVIALQKSFRGTKKSNFIEILDYCMEHCPEFDRE